MAGVGIEQAFLVGEQQQRIGFQQVGHQRAEGVIIAKADLVGDDGIVFVDHRYHAHFDQRAQCRERIQVALAVREVVVGKQNLRVEHAVARKVLLVALSQAILAHGGGRLQLVHGAGACLPAQAHHASCHRTGGDQHHLFTLLMQGGNLIHPAANGRFVQPTTIISEQRAANFDHYPAGATQRLTARQLLVAFHVATLPLHCAHAIYPS